MQYILLFQIRISRDEKTVGNQSVDLILFGIRVSYNCQKDQLNSLLNIGRKGIVKETHLIINGQVKVR